MIDLRPYQREAIEAVMAYWSQGGGNPLVDLATGMGKSVVVATLTRQIVERFPDMRVLVLVHVRELVEQNYRALLRLWPDAPAGIYSAGLGARDSHHRITFASIQSVYRKGRLIGPRDLIIIDEAHLVPNGGDGMYRTLLASLREERPDLRVCGLTATPYRLDSGRLDQGRDRLFDEIVYSYGIGPGIADGWLSPLVSKASTGAEIDVSDVARRGGEFVSGALQVAAMDDAVTRGAVAELMRYGAERRSWLIFCSGVQHAEAFAAALRVAGVSAAHVTGETPPAERDRLVREFKAGTLRALTNAQVLTTGFDAPATDLIAFLRPTLSTGLYVQMIGRGTRLAAGKTNCLVLDFAGNVRRHGPVDLIEIKPRHAMAVAKEAAVSVDSVRAKECPDCHALVGLATRTCPDCGHEWPMQEKPRHEARADTVAVLSTEPQPAEEVRVISWEAARHSKIGSPDSVRVSFFGGLLAYREWVCFEHEGYAGSRAREWWARHGGLSPAPRTVTEALDRWDELTPPEAIRVRMNGKWPEIIGRRFPAPRDEAAA